MVEPANTPSMEENLVPISLCRRGMMVTIEGTVGMITVSPKKAKSKVVAYCYDGTGEIELVWLGRRQISGIEVGQRLQVHGRVAVHGRELAIYNPSYELM
ncbi:MAG: OB-fold nucleic acid binding domain-containing protein [Lawsonella sp.]